MIKFIDIPFQLCFRVRH